MQHKSDLNLNLPKIHYHYVKLSQKRAKAFFEYILLRQAVTETHWDTYEGFKLVDQGHW